MAERKSDFAAFTAQDIRFTIKDDVLYAICLDWPGKELSIKSLSTRTYLGSGGDIRYLFARSEREIDLVPGRYGFED